MKKKYKILFKYSSRSRKNKFFVGLDNIISKISDKENYLIVVSLDYDDKEMFNKEVLERLIPYIENYKVYQIH
jgi:ribosomal protein L7Ae-like RNA K-turn-binding protein